MLRELNHPEQGFRACVGIHAADRGLSREGLEAACSLDAGSLPGRTHASKA
jgi:hypothetical protein